MSTQTDQLDETGLVIFPDTIDQAFRQNLNDAIEGLFVAEAATPPANFKPDPGGRRLANLVKREYCQKRFIAGDPPVGRLPTT